MPGQANFCVRGAASGIRASVSADVQRVARAIVDNVAGVTRSKRVGSLGNRVLVGSRSRCGGRAVGDSRRCNRQIAVIDHFVDHRSPDVNSAKAGGRGTFQREL